jgi:carbamoyl-phosphate synthase small subunit
MKATLAIETGKVFVGRSFGAEKSTAGEVVFCTAMTGYQEVLTDPSYQGQIVVMTVPHVGNYGTHADLNESRKAYVSGFVAREFSDVVSHWQPAETLLNFMKSNGVVGIQDIDTRALTRHLRTMGVCQGVIGMGDMSEKDLVNQASRVRSLAGSDLVKEVTCDHMYRWDVPGAKPPRRKIVVMDFGVKHTILRSLAEAGCAVTVVPASTSARDILALSPDGVMLSNGPGDPAAVSYAIQTIRDLVAASGAGPF